MGKTTTATVEKTVEIPTVDERDLSKYFILVDRHGEVDGVFDEAKDAEDALREGAKNRNGMGDMPSLYLLEVKGVPTDQALAQAAKA